MITRLCHLICTLLFLSVAASAEVETILLRPARDMTRAEVHIWKGVPSPRAVLVLCPGANGNGEGLIRRPEWQEFARQHQIALAGLSFASESTDLSGRERGYYYASRGSGDLLVRALRQGYGRDLPLLLYGFSGGAHFTSRFVEWAPQRVLGWCAYSAAWWDEPRGNRSGPPGIVACGDEDPGRYGPSLVYFKQGRAAGRPWLWVSLPRTGHVGSPRLDALVRDYFSTLLKVNFTSDGIWVDVYSKIVITANEAQAVPALSAWLPGEHLLKPWSDLHEP